MSFFSTKASTKVGGTLSCPWCNGTKIKEVDRQPPDRVFYRCKTCNKSIIYISTPMSVDEHQRLLHAQEHPYAHHRQGLGRQIRIPGLGSFRIKK